MAELIAELTSLAYKSRFSIYYKPNECIVRTYFSDGGQHKETATNIPEAIAKMNGFLKRV